MIPETIRRAFRVAWTPPYGPTYATWNSDYTGEKIQAEIIRHDQVDPRMRVRPNPAEVEHAARLLVEARRPLLIVGDEVYKAKAFDKVVQLAELLALPRDAGAGGARELSAAASAVDRRYSGRARRTR